MFEEQYEGVKYIKPGSAIFSIVEGSLVVELPEKGEVHNRVLAFRSAPLSHPRHFVSLRVGDAKGQDVEIGMIEDLDEFPDEDKEKIELELRKRYFVYKVTAIHSIREEIGWLYWSVETDKGTKEFSFPRWRQSCVQDLRANGKIIYDYDRNRYEIEDMRKLDQHGQKLFYRYIYW